METFNGSVKALTFSGPTSPLDMELRLKAFQPPGVVLNSLVGVDLACDESEENHTRYTQIHEGAQASLKPVGLGYSLSEKE